MDGAGASTAAQVAAPASEASALSTHDDDVSRHCATTASQVPKPTGTMAPLMLPPVGTAEPVVKDAKGLGTRFLEDIHETDLPSPRLRSSRLYKGKGKETLHVEREAQKRPLQLLDLPIDILKDIVKEVTHTNDLTSLALCHSALHRLTIPHIYSRFDIVWPDTTTNSEPRSGVDALTYGLATLVMAEEIFGEAPNQRQAHSNRFTKSGHGKASDITVRRRRGNHYAQFTRKFSLGNGPTDWVAEYLIAKEGGKMLGTLVALAVARMRSLETFVWDMPTGVLRDVWLALSSLADRDDGQPCRLEKVWVRWHDNSSPDSLNPIPPPPPAMNISMPLSTPLNAGPIASLPPQVHPAQMDRVEHPSFSTLPPLKSLSVLDIDELSYLDEMAVLIGRSLDKLRELRVGIARHAMARDWVTVWEGNSLQQVDPRNPAYGSLTIGEKRLGGVLGTLTGFVCDMRKPRLSLADRTKRRSGSSTSTPVKPLVSVVQPPVYTTLDNQTSAAEQMNGPPAVSSPENIELPSNGASSPPKLSPLQIPSWNETAYENDPLVAQSSHASSPLRSPLRTPPSEASIFGPSANDVTSLDIDATEGDSDEYLNNTLRLETLELERVPLSVPVLQRAIDWTRLTSLTILNCQNHEQLWKTLRRTFAPRPKSPTYPQPRRASNLTPRKANKLSIGGSDIELEYSLNLKKIHTNNVSTALISFLKETLAPNSLQVLFLQDARSYSSAVTVDQIFKGPLRRHRGSLKKLLIDSAVRDREGVPLTDSSRWRRWILPRDILGFICSGKMPALRELGMAIEYRDWHFFLQHLPSIPHLRSISIPFLADHVHGPDVDLRELALQIVDIVALRPEVEICYMGIANKCFEILENRRASSSSWDTRPQSHLDLNGTSHEDDDDDGMAPAEVDDDGNMAVNQAEADDDIDVADEDEVTGGIDTDDDDDDADMDSDGNDSDVGGRGKARLRLREILFYDDKVAVFKARHGRL